MNFTYLFNEAKFVSDTAYIHIPIKIEPAADALYLSRLEGEIQSYNWTYKHDMLTIEGKIIEALKDFEQCMIKTSSLWDDRLTILIPPEYQDNITSEFLLKQLSILRKIIESETMKPAEEQLMFRKEARNKSSERLLQLKTL